MRRLKKNEIELAAHAIILICIMLFGVNTAMDSMTKNMLSAEEQQVSEVSETERPQDMASIHKDNQNDCKSADATDGTKAKQAEDTKEAQLTIEQYPAFTHSRDWSENDQYLLAKLAMCEAGTQNMQTKCLVILTVYNRLYDDRFPDTVEEIIFQHDGGVYQYSPCALGGSWYSTECEPDQECYDAVKQVMEEQYDYSGGALFFEAFATEEQAANSWHGRCLTYLYQSQDVRFYK